MAELQPASQEAERIGSGITLGVTGWVLLFGAILSIAAWLMLGVRNHSLQRSETVSTSAAPRPEPEVSNVRSELFRGPAAGERLKAAQLDKLRHFGWVEQGQQVVRIPIDVAMDLEVQGAGQ